MGIHATLSIEAGAANPDKRTKTGHWPNVKDWGARDPSIDTGAANAKLCNGTDHWSSIDVGAGNTNLRIGPQAS